MPLVAPPPARLKTRTEFSITLEVPSASASASTGAAFYRYEYREACEPSWTNARIVTTKPGDKNVLLDDLNPTSTYEIRIYAVAKDPESGKEEVSEPSEVAAVDTEVPGCAPEPKCVIQ